MAVSAYGPGGRTERHRELPAKGERVTIRWPGGPYDFVIQFDAIDESMPRAEDGWLWMTGYVVEPVGPRHQTWQTFYVRPDGDDYALIPKLSWTKTDPPGDR